MIFVTQLKSANTFMNLYARSILDHSELINNEHDLEVLEEQRFWEIEKVINRREQLYDNQSRWEYLLKWTRYNLEHNVWRFLKNCERCMNLVEKYERHYLRSEITRQRSVRSKNTRYLSKRIDTNISTSEHRQMIQVRTSSRHAWRASFAKTLN